jgi:hypothetical protein
VSADFWNGILRDHAEATAITSYVTKAVTPEEYRGWYIDWNYGYFNATGPDYDASYEGPEDGWVDNGHRVSARTLSELYEEVDAFLAEHDQ